MRRTPRRPSIDFTNPFARWGATIGFALLAAITVGQALDASLPLGGRIWFGGLALVSVVVAYRAARSYALRADDHGVVVSTMLRRHDLPWSEIECFETDTRPVVAWPRTYLVAVLHDGSRRDLSQEINARRTRPERPSPVEGLADELNDLVTRHAHPGGTARE